MLKVRLKQWPLFVAMAAAGMGTTVLAQSNPATVSPARSAAQTVAVDGIAAVVNEDVITLRELNARVTQAQQELTSQKVALPPVEVLQRQVLERMISERLEDQEAERLNLNVSDADVQQAISTIAQRNGFTEEQMKQQVQASGLPWSDYLQVLRRDVMLDRLRQRVVDTSIYVSDAEVDAFIRDEKSKQSASPSASAPANQGQVTLAQILIRVPEGASAAEESAARQRAEAILAQLQGGADFAALAAAESQGPEALQGGVMGERPLSGWPDLFARAVAGTPPGGVSELVRSGVGFHILKVVAQSGGQQAGQGNAAQGPDFTSQQPMPVTQTHARHILIRTTAVVSDERARLQLEQLRQRIVEGGESFADLARRYSKDSNAPQGGDLGWLSPGETVPQFEQAMDELGDGGVSQPVKSPFGWHLILVESRRTQDMAETYQRMQARRILFERRAVPAFEEWLEQLRDRAFIDNRLERRQRLEQE